MLIWIPAVSSFFLFFLVFSFMDSVYKLKIPCYADMEMENKI